MNKSTTTNKGVRFMNTEVQINPLFASHILNDAGIEKAKVIAGEFHSFICSLEAIVLGETEGGREWSILRTKLEEAAFFAKKAMATQAKYQRTE